MIPLIVFLILSVPLLGHTATYYVSRNGNNNNSCSTASAAGGCSGGTCSKLTISTGTGSGISCMSGGDTLLVNSGTYTQDPIFNFPNGSSSQRTIIKSMNGRANTTLICNNTALDALVSFSNKSFVDVDGFLLDGNAFCAFPVGGNNNTSDVTIKNSRLTRSRHSCLLTDHAVRFNVEGNEIDHCGDNPDLDHGVYFTAANSIIRNNYIHHNQCWGMQIQSGEGSPPVPQNNKAYGNIFEANGCGGLVSSQGSDHQIVNNVFVNESTQVTPPNGSYGLDFAVPNGKVFNNTFYCSTMREIEYATGGAVVANNLFYCPGTTLTIQRRTGGSFAATYTSNMLNQDPLFVNVNAPSTGGFKLSTGSPAVNGVTCRAEANPDAAGVARPQPSGGQCDYGAYELGSGSPPVEPPASAITVHVSPSGLDSRTCTQATSQSTPRQTLLGGIACLTAPGSTLLLHTGTYVEAFDSAINAIAGGTSFATPTSIAAFGSDVVTVRAPAVDTSVFLFQTSATDQYIILDRLIIDCNNLSGTNGVVAKNGVHHIRVQNSEVKSCYYEPVFTLDADDIQILRNHIHHSSAARCVAFSQGSDNGVIDGNNIHDCFGAGIRITSPGTNNYINRNTITTSGAGQSRPGVQLNGITNSFIVNNIIYGNYVGVIAETGTTGLKVLNNTIYGNTGNGLQIDSGASAANVTNNIMANNGGTNFVNNGTVTSQLTNLTTAPLFVNAGAGDFHLDAMASTAIDTGTTLTADVPIDFEETPRPQNAGYDIGADEFTGTPGTPPVIPPAATVRAPYWKAHNFFWR